MFLDVRYSLGLNNALEDREIKDVMLEDEDARNNGVQISVGLIFLDRSAIIFSPQPG